MKLNAQQKASFGEKGFLIVTGILDLQKDLKPVFDQYIEVLDDLARKLHSNRDISSLFKSLDFSDRYIAIMRETGKVFAEYFDFTLPQSDITADTPICLTESIFNILSNPKILDIAESIVGTEIYVSPVQHIRIKPPEDITPKDEESGRVLMGATPWHQDAGVVRPEADQTNNLTIWSPLCDVNETNGCLYVIPGSHQKGIIDHCPGYVGGASAFVPDKLFNKGEALALPMKAGDILLLHRNIIHGSLSNKSKEIRWSFDLRYCPVGQPTGRDMYPGFVARSRKSPASVLSTFEEWVRLWQNAKQDLVVRPYKGSFHRWGYGEVCA